MLGTPARSRGSRHSRCPEHCASAVHARKARFRTPAKPTRATAHAHSPLFLSLDGWGRSCPCLESSSSPQDPESRRAQALPLFPNRRPQEGKGREEMEALRQRRMSDGCRQAVATWRSCKRVNACGGRPSLNSRACWWGRHALGAASLELAINSLFLAPASSNGPLLPNRGGKSSPGGRQAWCPIVEKVLLRF